MSRALEAQQGGDQPLAIELLDRVVTAAAAWLGRGLEQACDDLLHDGRYTGP